MYRVFGYNDLCDEFDTGSISFVRAIQIIRDNQFCVLFQDGLSQAVVDRLHDFGYWI